MSANKLEKINIIHIVILCISGIASIIAVGFSLYSNHETIRMKQKYYDLTKTVNMQKLQLEKQLGSQQMQLRSYQSSKDDLDFWNAYESTLHQLGILGEHLGENIALAEASLYVKYGNKNMKLYKETSQLFFDQGLNHKKLPAISYPGAVMLSAIKIYSKSGLFVVKYQHMAKTLNIKNWKEFVMVNQAISKQINSIVSKLDMTTGELNQILPVMPINQYVFHNLHNTYPSKQELLMKYINLTTQLDHTVELLIGNMNQLLKNNIIHNQ